LVGAEGEVEHRELLYFVGVGLGLALGLGAGPRGSSCGPTCPMTGNLDPKRRTQTASRELRSWGCRKSSKKSSAAFSCGALERVAPLPPACFCRSRID